MSGTSACASSACASSACAFAASASPAYAASDVDFPGTAPPGTASGGPPGQRPLSELEAQITELAGHLNAASHRWLMLIAEFDRREGWADGSTTSCAHWLGWKCGIDRGAAREKVRVARALEGLPLISAAMARGELSYSKVQALTRVATAETEESLLMIALHGTASHVENTVRLYRRAYEACLLEREAVQFANRSVSWFHDDDGSVVMRVRLPADTGAVVIKALELAADELRQSPAPPDLSAEPPEPPPRTQLRADVLPLFAETWLSHGYQSLGGGDRQQVVIHVDRATLQEAAPGRCEVEGGPSIATETARRLACDASLVRIVEDESGAPLDVGRKTRSIPPAIRRALQSRDAGCRFPGCTHTRFLDGHHIRHWADGGETRLSNLVMLCRFHHRQVHEGRINVRMLDDGALRFTGPRGKVLGPALAMAGTTRELVRGNRRDGLEIGPQTAVTRWCGEPIDYDLVVACLLDQQVRGQRQKPVAFDEPQLPAIIRDAEGRTSAGWVSDGWVSGDRRGVSAERPPRDRKPPPWT